MQRRVLPQGLAPGALLVGVGVITALHTLDLDTALPRTSEVHITLETSATLVAGLAAFLFVGRFLRRRLVGDLLLLSALVMVTISCLLLWSLPVLDLLDWWSSAAWELTILQLLAALLFIAAAWAPRRTLRSPRTLTIILLAALGPALLAVLVAALRAGSSWPSYALPPGQPQQLHPAAVGLEVVVTLATLAATVGMWQRHAREPDPFLLWLTASLGVRFLARYGNLLDPSLYIAVVQINDLLRLLSLLLLLVGALREISATWQDYADNVLASERRRVARELHDGVAQEINFVLAAARSAHERCADHATLEEIEDAAARALDETRAAIAAVQRLPDEPVERILEVFADQLATRFGARVLVSCDTPEDINDTTLTALVRIMREAVTNAAMHGGASTIEVELRNGPANLLRIRDDGCGFDLHHLGGVGFGLTSMRQRAALIGATIRVDTAPGQGTNVEIEW